MKSFLKNKPAFIFVLPVFFVFHGFVEHYNFVSVNGALLLLLIYTDGAFVIASIAWLFYRNFIKAGIISFYIMSFFFFFGSIQDVLRDRFAGNFLSRYSFILPVMFLSFIILIIWLKKREAPLHKLIFFLNVLFLLFIVIDFVELGRIMVKDKVAFDPGTKRMTVCDTCKKPDIFFIILDEYAANRELKEFFNFDNSEFEQQLEQRGFHISGKSNSNYNFTPFSVASVLNMDYLDLNMKTKAPGNINYCYGKIKNSSVVNFLMANGYEFYNYSIFDFEGRPAVKYDNFLPNNTTLISSQTFISRIMKDIWFNIGTGKWRIKPAMKKVIYEHLHNNEEILELTKTIALKKNDRPKFVYTHLMMPHYPYYFNSKGEALPPEELLEGKQINKKNYVEYLQYCNKQILVLIDLIKTRSASMPVIMLLGDHGFREITKKGDRKYAFMNLNAIYLPDKNYGRFYDSMSNVNHFRIFFNTAFHQQLPLLKDSTIFLWDN